MNPVTPPQLLQLPQDLLLPPSPPATCLPTQCRSAWFPHLPYHLPLGGACHLWFGLPSLDNALHLPPPLPYCRQHLTLVWFSPLPFLVLPHLVPAHGALLLTLVVCRVRLITPTTLYGFC